MAEEVRSVEAAGADWLHIDIMDGHFVPNLTMGPDMVRAVNEVTDLFLDVHLMVTEPHLFFEPFVKAGADLLTFHIEVVSDPAENVELIRKLGCQAGLSLNPDQPVEAVLPHLHLVDLVLLMSVFPGYSGQKFIPQSVTKAARIREFIDRNDLRCRLQVDGGVNRQTAPDLIHAGVDVLVMGSAFFGDTDRHGLIRELKHIGRDESE